MHDVLAFAESTPDSVLCQAKRWRSTPAQGERLTPRTGREPRYYVSCSTHIIDHRSSLTTGPRASSSSRLDSSILRESNGPQLLAQVSSGCFPRQWRQIPHLLWVSLPHIWQQTVGYLFMSIYLCFSCLAYPMNFLHVLHAARRPAYTHFDRFRQQSHANCSGVLAGNRWMSSMVREC